MKQIIGFIFLLVTTQQVYAFNIGLMVEGSISNAETNLIYYISENPANTLTTINNTTFNSMTPAALAAAYDIIVIPWRINSSANLDWTTRLLPYLTAGGNILWEDPLNIGDLAASGIVLTSDNAIYPGIGESDITLVPPFDANGGAGHYHIHYGITAHNADWEAWSTDINGGIHGVYGQFGSGRMMLGVSDNLYHPLMSSASDTDHYNLLVSQINWLVTGSVTGEPPVESIPTLSQWSLIITSILMGMFYYMGLGWRRR